MAKDKHTGQGLALTDSRAESIFTRCTGSHPVNTDISRVRTGVHCDVTGRRHGYKERERVSGAKSMQLSLKVWPILGGLASNYRAAFFSY